MAKNYRGDRTIDGIDVTVDGESLPDYIDVRKFTDLGFEWTYVGDSSRQLALAILMDHTGDAVMATSLVEAFTEEVVANLNNEWEMTSADVEAAIAALA